MKKWMGVALIFIMFSSSIAFAVVSSVTTPGQQHSQAPGMQIEELPTNPIIDYTLSPSQLNLAISQGLTVVTYKYEKTCIECADQRALLEQAVYSREFQGQIILEEIESSGPPSMEAVSFLGARSVESIDRESVVGALCELASNPPIGCALGQNITSEPVRP
jgi:hypothetical protein